MDVEKYKAEVLANNYDLKSIQFGMRLATQAIKETCQKGSEVAPKGLTGKAALRIMAEELETFPIIGE